MKVVFQLTDKECHARRVIADVGQIHPKTNWEGLARSVQESRATDLSAPGMACLLPQILPTRNLEIAHKRFYTLDCAA